MKKHFFAKLGHFFLVSAVLFNTFGVAFVHADGSVTQFFTPIDTQTETDSTSFYTVSVEYTGVTTLDADKQINVSVVTSTADFYFTNSTGSENFGNTSTTVTFPSSTESGNKRPVYLNIVGDDVFSGDKIIILQDDDNTTSTFTLTIKEDEVDTSTYVPIFSDKSSAVYEGAATGAKVTELTNNSNTDLTYTIGLTGGATLGQDFGLFVIDSLASSTEITNSSTFDILVAKNSTSTFSVYTDGSYDNSSFDNVAKQTIWTVTNANDGTTNYDLSSSSVQFTLDIKDDENSVNFIKSETSVNENTNLTTSTATFAGGYKLAYSNDTENNIALTFELSGTASSSTDYTVRTEELSSSSTWIVPKNSVKSFPADILNVNGNKTLILTVTQIDILNVDGTIKNRSITPLVTTAQKQTLTILDTDSLSANVSFETSTFTVDENAGDVNVATVVNHENQDISVKFTLSGSATSTTDYTLRSGTGTLIFDNGSEVALLVTQNSTSSFPLTINTVDSDKTIIITLTTVGFVDNSTTTLFTGDSITSHTITIHNVTSTGENQDPVVSSTIPTQKLDLYTHSTSTIDNLTLTHLFTDPDNDRLTLRLSGNTDETVATATTDEEFSAITLTGLTVGTSTIEITATDTYDATATTTFDVVVTDSAPTDNGGNTDDNTGSGSSGGGSSLLPNTAPQAALTTGQEVTVEVNKEITFDASGSIDKEGNIRFYFWNFGDGTPEVYYTVPTTTHTYSKVGTYTLTTKVKDAYGAESSAEVTVHVVKGNSTPSTTDNTGNTTKNTNTETGTTPENTTSTTPVEETGSTGTINTNINNGSTNTENNTTEPNSGEEQNTTEENTGNNNTPENNTPEETVSSTPESGDQNLPTWIKILFGSGALAAVAGAGIAINRVRKNV